MDTGSRRRTLSPDQKPDPPQTHLRPAADTDDRRRGQTDPDEGGGAGPEAALQGGSAQGEWQTAAPTCPTSAAPVFAAPLP